MALASVAYDPSSHLSLRHLVVQLQPPHDPWLAPFCHTCLPSLPAAYSTAATLLRLGFLWYCTASLGSCLPMARPLTAGHYVVGMSHLTRLVHGLGVTVVLPFVFFVCLRAFLCFGGPLKGFLRDFCLRLCDSCTLAKLGMGTGGSGVRWGCVVFPMMR